MREATGSIMTIKGGVYLYALLILGGCGVSVSESVKKIAGPSVPSTPTGSPAAAASSIGTDSHATSGQGAGQIARSSSYAIQQMRAFGAVQPTRARSSNFIVTVGVHRAE